MTTTTYEEHGSVRAARERYFAANGFDGSYGEGWVTLRAGPLTLYLPNAEGRRRAVRFHDLHHIATGYQTDWTGEVEIGAYEIGAGCGRFAWAWLLNLQALMLAPLLAPRRALRAFVRGRHARTLYHAAALDGQGELPDALLDRSLGQLRRTLGLDRPSPPATAGDVAAFGAWIALGLAAHLAPLALLVWWLVG